MTNFGVKADVAYTAGRTQREGRRRRSARRSWTRSSRSGSPIRPFNDLPARPEISTRRSLPYDLTRGGAPLAYDAGGDHQAAGGLRPGRHQGRQRDVQARRARRPLRRADHRRRWCSRASACRTPCRGSGTVLRASYGRTLETPYNENLLLSSGFGLGGLFGDGQILAARHAQPGRVRRPAGSRPVAGGRLRLLQQAHRQRLRLRRAVRHADRRSRSRGITRGSTASPAGSTSSSTTASARSS